MASPSPNPLLSTAGPTDSSVSVQLHPLVLLTISDYVTRHTLREQKGPIVGAIIGQQNGREVTMEHAFQCKLGEKDGRVVVDEEWFQDRLEQFRDVHKAPALDLVAVFTLGPPTGPLAELVPLVQQLQHLYNDSLILLLFHPETVLDGSLRGGKLPITLYESYYEPGSEGADKGLQVDGWGLGTQLQLRFRKLDYEVETGEAEMIGIDFVAKGGGNAAAIAPLEAQVKPSSSKKGKAKVEEDTTTNGAASENYLSAEDDELLASLTTKTNAIRMLHDRLDLLKSYLSSLPPTYLTDATATIPTDSTLNHPLLRSISSLLSRLPLLAPPTALTTSPPTPSSTAAPTSTSLATASAQEQADVHLVSLLSSLTRSIAEAKELGAKYSVVTKAREEKTPLSRLEGYGGFRGGEMVGGEGGGGFGNF